MVSVFNSAKTNENENGKTKMQMEIGDENGVGDDTSSRRVYFMDRETKWRHFMYLICAAYECVLARVCACVCVCLCNRNVYKLCE